VPTVEVETQALSQNHAVNAWSSCRRAWPPPITHDRAQPWETHVVESEGS